MVWQSFLAQGRKEHRAAWGNVGKESALVAKTMVDWLSRVRGERDSPEVACLIVRFYKLDCVIRNLLNGS